MDPIVSTIVSLAGELPLVDALRSTLVAYALVSAAHVFSIGLLVGAIVPLDLGIIGMSGFHWARSAAGPLRRMAVAGFAGAASTGICLFAVHPLDYLHNSAFLMKLAAILAAGFNVFVFSMIGTALVRRVLAAMSLAIWTFVLLAGRWIGFV